jgi:glycosyltransferase involved in cell wall biosynthesis
VDFTVRQFIAPVVLRLEKEGYEVRAACTRGPHWEELRAMGVKMVDMPIARSANPIKALGSALKLLRWLRRERIDVLHVHTPVASFVGRFAGWLAGVPLIIYTAHGFYFHDRMPWKSRLLHVALERFFGLFNGALFCVSREDAAAAVRLGIAKRSRVWHVPNGVDADRFSRANVPAAEAARIRVELGIPQDAHVVSIMGRLVREKGYQEFFEAARAVAMEQPDAHFLVIGDTVASEHDDAKTEILRLAAVPELTGRVHFAGLRRDIPELLAASQLFVLPSYREGMPVSILEAMMMELPVIATRVRGCREEVVDGETGLLVEPRNGAELTGALRWMLDHRNEAAAMGRLGRTLIAEKLHLARVLDRQVVIYKRLLERLAR